MLTYRSRDVSCLLEQLHRRCTPFPHRPSVWLTISYGFVETPETRAVPRNTPVKRQHWQGQETTSRGTNNLCLRRSTPSGSILGVYEGVGPIQCDSVRGGDSADVATCTPPLRSVRACDDTAGCRDSTRLSHDLVITHSSQLCSAVLPERTSQCRPSHASPSSCPPALLEETCRHCNFSCRASEVGALRAETSVGRSCTLRVHGSQSGHAPSFHSAGSPKSKWGMVSRMLVRSSLLPIFDYG
jgi:hypothetical protein